MAATEPQTKARARKVSVSALIALVVVALAVYAFDQGTKYLIVANLNENDQVEVLGTLLQFHFVKNSGAAFSLASGTTWIFSIAASAVTVVIIYFARRIRSIGWAVLFGMLLGGTTGNLTDRLFREPGFGVGHVVDFVQIAGFPAIFNIADSFICASMVLFVILTIRGVRLDGTRTVKASDAAPDDDSVPHDSAPRDSAPHDPAPKD
ncbi:signal peptidase II [Lacisediminihabitans changchengi]|uniref:signal peptidase II n=1 Tax=Lacisediminihabitans changchengi TaxID=2787634 RepID=UPI001F20B2D8|nr:signal peptidase II [Lacisediminihabitans changchengi]